MVITGIAIFLRALPAFMNAAWGCDFGIYYGLTNSFVSNGEWIGDSPAWGGAYQYFPVLYAITGGAHWLTGIDILTLMPKLVPIFGGLSVLIFYFIVNDLLGDRKKALLASLFLAVLPFHVYQTSQAAPLTIGNFFYMLSFFFFLRSRTSSKYLFGLVISTILMILTHHLTMYFYLISIVFVLFFENARNSSWTKTIRQDMVYLFGASTATFLYWNIVATPVYKGFMSHGIVFGNIVFSTEMTIALFYVVCCGLLGIAWGIRKVWPYHEKSVVLKKSSPALFFGVLLGLLVLLGIVFLFPLPWAQLYFTPKSIAYALPLLVLITLGVLGLKQAQRIANWQIIGGWFSALFLSFVYGFLSLNSTLLPHRHLEYIVAPLLIFSVYGLYSLSRYDYSFLASWKSLLLKKRQLLYPFAVVLLVASNAASVYPSYLAWESLEVSYETITADNLAAISWLDKQVDHNASVIAADHRLALLAEAVGFNTTQDKPIYLWNSSKMSDFSDELRGVVYNYSRVTHVIVDSLMRDNIVHIGFDGKKAFMTNASYDKFCVSPFELVYRNATYNREFEEMHWTEVYYVNWSQIEDGMVFIR
ncbi:MAG: hypothetical protein KKC68_02075 [Candidatus Thermoplasmatota archaeon]|nr:hypothetical protein [Candidatus Thermoplasmatota archaeon]MBU1940537.1 hypothetical protein [Candidatus Thermoplasmatota archaeon]